jgi:hypothetical protein
LKQFRHDNHSLSRWRERAVRVIATTLTPTLSRERERGRERKRRKMRPTPAVTAQ